MNPGANGSLEAVLATDELARRPARARDFERERHALLQLVEELGQPSRHVFQRVAELALEVCEAGSAGVSIREHKEGKARFRWSALVGALRDRMWSLAPQDASPSAVTLERNATQLFRFPARHFRHLAEIQPPIVELLSSPFSVDGRAIGIVWAIHHRQEREFDAEDVRLLETLALAAAAGFRASGIVDSLRQSNRHKDEFLAVLSHEMRNPLAAMSNAIRYLGHVGSKEPDQERARSVILRQLAQVTRLGEDLLDVSRVGHGTLALHLERTDFVTAARMGIEAASPALAEYDRELTLTLPDAPMWVEGDATRLSQVVINLLTNVARRTRAGAKVSLALQRDGDEAVLVVASETEGIAAGWAVPPRDPYAPVSDEMRTPEQQGIGLALARSLTEMHGGRVATVSVGEAAENGFEVRLALREATGTVVERAASRPARTVVREGRRRERVLIVDDSVDSSDSLAMLLRSWGHDVRTAQGATAGLRVEWEFEPHAVILDIEMPGKNGYEVAAELRVRRRRDLLLVALSGHAREEDRAQSLEAGFDHHMTKPANVEMLQRLLS
jgi:signal transduction histidine kinase